MADDFDLSGFEALGWYGQDGVIHILPSVERRLIEFVGWLCPRHSVVIHPDTDGSKPPYHLEYSEMVMRQCTLDPDLWEECFVRRQEKPANLR